MMEPYPKLENTWPGCETPVVGTRLLNIVVEILEVGPYFPRQTLFRGLDGQHKNEQEFAQLPQ